MTHEDFAAARQLLAEEFVGSRVRKAAHAEDARFQASVSALKRDSA